MDQNLETKNEYFLKKEEKDKIRMEERKNNIMKKGMKWLGLLVVAGLFIWWGYNYFKTASIDKPISGEYFKAQSRDHIDIGSEHPAYNSNPPTGGWHYDQPAQSGIYDKEFPDEQLVHNLEHSHAWIAYRPDLPADQIDKLADIAKDYGSKIIMTPRQANDTPIAFVAWERLLKMDILNESLAREFIEAYRGLAGPEKLADFGFKDFRGAKEQPLGPKMR
ncbi:MAG: hypothetical protein A2817_02315 [Candidatus Yanofskybacteria bacterium RIFCSPHIGHO2_01_FULL_39_8b]|uniref:DUF3105 domain-containing protein n=1 Tax=Candidatus Yanofskybacteria bacterium RIFCSPHIGHO2_01_FULL_39_8b TaxID=1802659 RepID=A0A1F8ECT1_9BACT|nr:MAG: hypothetical protein A2817_02315 [Candidatus Yanofskybacteria bacterium RIFCSPHIGHO2_01_FULL_39_8b]